MGVFAWLRGVCHRLFNRGPEKADRRRQTRTSAEPTVDPTVTVHVYQSSALAQRRGRTPERMVTRQLANALDAGNVSYRISFGFRETFDPPDREHIIAPETLDWWRGAAPRTDADTSLLLIDAIGGGYGYVGGDYCFSGANRITEMRPATTRSEHPPDSSGREQDRNCRAAMHEVGHTYGGRHDTPILADLPDLLYSEEMLDVFREHDTN